MATVMGRGLQRLGYRRTRVLLLLTGLTVLILVAALTWVRRVETVEVVATLLFFPVFVALFFWKVPGGVVAGVLAAATYAVLRLPAIDAVGVDRFLGLIVSRSLSLIAFGAIGGWAVRQLEASARKLDVYDQVDDLTGLLNARFLLQDTDLEMARAQRYRTIFSIGSIEIPAAGFQGLTRRRANRLYRELGRWIREGIRTVDRAVHVRDQDRHHLAIILPETGREGAEVFVNRLRSRLRDWLAERGATFTEEQLTARALTLPDDGDELEELRALHRRIDEAERPEAPTAEEAIPG